MGQPTPYGKYRQTQIGTASQVRLIVMLHDGAIRFLKQTIVAMNEGDLYKKCQNLNKALEIITHLWASLDYNNSPDISGNMARIFQYMHARLVQANIDNDAGPMEEAIGYFSTLREAWDQVDRFSQQNTEKTPTAELSAAA